MAKTPLKVKAIFAAALFSVMILSQSASAASFDIWPFKRRKSTQKEQTTTEATTPAAYQKFKKDESKCCEGFIALHLKDDKVFFELTDDILGRDMLLGSTIKSTSDNSNGIVGAKEDLVHFTFTRKGDKVQMRSVDAGHVGTEPNIQRALGQSHMGAVMQNFDIKCFSDDGSSYIIDVTDIFLSDDIKALSPFAVSSIYSSYSVSSSFRRENSFIEDIKAFSDNVSVTSVLSYSYSVRGKDGTTLVRESPFSAQMLRSIVLLPREVYHPRAADPRIGYFHTQRTQTSDISRTSANVNLVNRWNLSPKDTAAYLRGEKVEPIKPIVFYIDSNFPEWWKPYVRKAVQMWNEPFERIGFKNAIIAKDFPTDDPEFDPDNIKYSCIRYAPISLQNSLGPSWVDPRSGEIINASVFIYHDVMKLLQEWIFVQTAQADHRVRTTDIPKEILGEALCYVVRHELGHTLGLRHNMGASATIPVDSLRSATFTKKYGTTMSIMDYARFNYIAKDGDLDKGVQINPPSFGPYDYYAIRWGYQPVFTDDFEKERQITSDWITEALGQGPIYRYGKQQSSSRFFDPRSQAEDLGDDPVRASALGIENLKYIMENLSTWIDGPMDEDFSFRKMVLEGILSQYQKYVRHTAMQVGGIYVNEVSSGDGQKRFENIPSHKQKEALSALMAMGQDTEWLNNKSLFKKIGFTKDLAKQAREAVWSEMLLTPMYASISDGVDSREFSSTECMDLIYDYVFQPTKASSRLSSDQRDLQDFYIDALIEFGDFKTLSSSSSRSLVSLDGRAPISGFEMTPRAPFNPGDLSPAVIYAYLIKARDLITGKKASASDIDKAHYELLLGKINYSIK